MQSTGRLYPSLNMMRVSAEFELRLKSKNEKAVQDYLDGRAIPTMFDDTQAIIMVVEIFKLQRTRLHKKEENKQVLEELRSACEKLSIPTNAAMNLFMSLLEKFSKRCLVVFIFTQDGKQHELFDLGETAESERYITVQECGACRAKDTETHRLLVCNRCKQAAYCNKECQEKDWKAFHKHYCAKLKEEAEAALANAKDAGMSSAK
jgi:MYND finger